MSGIYIHVPFCIQRCHYCDFYSTLRLGNRNSFVENLKREITDRKDFLDGEIIDTIYFGGGTPSVLSCDSIRLILERIKLYYSLSDDLEITLEANPDDLSEQYLTDLLASGVNRLSIGIQSFNDKDLKNLNRRHSAGGAITAVNQAIEIGFKNISIDLIYGLPEQRMEDWEENLGIAASLNVEHISAYHLTYEKGTNFYKWLKEGKLHEIDEEESVGFFLSAVEILERNGFEHYEISNFARNKKYSRHNTKYWFGEKYLGIGPSAHSYNGHLRQWNIADLDQWMNHEPGEVLRSEIINRSTRRNEMVMTRLRTTWGIPELEFIKEFGEDEWNKLLDQASHFMEKELMVLKGNRLVITRKGKFLSDGIIAELFFL